MRLKDASRASKCTHLNYNGSYKTFEKYKWKNVRIQNIYRAMLKRCYNKNNKDYIIYGGKGIKVYDEWIENPNKFEEWALKNGYSDNLSIDRIDSNKDYCPENCRWITLEDNAKYKSTTYLIEVNSEVHTGKDWSKKLGLGQNRINTYIRKYGIDNTSEFIMRYMNNPGLKRKHKQSIYDVYMSA